MFISHLNSPRSAHLCCVGEGRCDKARRRRRRRTANVNISYSFALILIMRVFIRPHYACLTRLLTHLACVHVTLLQVGATRSGLGGGGQQTQTEGEARRDRQARLGQREALEARQAMKRRGGVACGNVSQLQPASYEQASPFVKLCQIKQYRKVDEAQPALYEQASLVCQAVLDQAISGMPPQFTCFLGIFFRNVVCPLGGRYGGLVEWPARLVHSSRAGATRNLKRPKLPCVGHTYTSETDTALCVSRCMMCEDVRQVLQSSWRPQD